MSDAPDVRLLTDADVATVATAMARAFYDDPLQVWALPDGERRLDLLDLVFGRIMRYVTVPAGHSWTDATCSTAALWWPPPGTQLPPGEASAELVPMMAHLGEAAQRFATADAAMKKAHPSAPHFYLQGLGTDPPRQGCGLASAVLGPVLAQCDREGVPAYLESTKERNVAFYEHHGFRVTGTIDVSSDGPRLWAMWRDPQPSA